MRPAIRTPKPSGLADRFEQSSTDDSAPIRKVTNFNATPLNAASLCFIWFFFFTAKF